MQGLLTSPVAANGPWAPERAITQTRNALRFKVAGFESLGTVPTLVGLDNDPTSIRSIEPKALAPSDLVQGLELRALFGCMEGIPL